MRHLVSIGSIVLSSTLLISAASAQPASNNDVASRGDLPTQVSPAPGVRPATLSPDAVPQALTCAPGVIQGFHPGDAHTAVWLVCEEVRRQHGRPAALSPNDPPAAYRVGLLRLGQAVVLTVHVESPLGTVRDSRQLQLASPEEVVVAAPRVVEALFQGVQVTSTQRVSNLVGEETREYNKKPGEFLYGGGLVGTYVAGSSVGVQPGLDLRAGYETDRLGIGLGFRTSGGSDYGDDGSASHVAFNVGGRYFLSDADTGMFVGGGLAWSGLEVRQEYNQIDHSGGSFEGSGIGAYGEVGVELLRLHSSRLTFDLRFETPFYRLEQNGYYYDYDAPADSYVEPVRLDDWTYAVPITTGVSYTF